MIGRLVSGILSVLPRNVPTKGLVGPAAITSPSQWDFTSVRTKFFYITKPRYNFPRPSEYKRVTVHGWNARLATLSGRKILMRRILKGKHVLSH